MVQPQKILHMNDNDIIKIQQMLKIDEGDETGDEIEVPEMEVPVMVVLLPQGRLNLSAFKSLTPMPSERSMLTLAFYY